jgi:predicted ATP-grasp superfamily ATP-dependent carboligase
MGCEVSALCASRLDVAYTSRHTNHRILGVCDNTQVEKTTIQFKELLKTGKYDLAVPTTDFSAYILSKNYDEFSNYTHVASVKWDAYNIASDKLSTMKVCMKEGIPCPITLLSVVNIEQIIDMDLRYPIVVKPRIGYGAIGFKRIDTPEEIHSLFSDKTRRAIDYVFQEYIPQTDIQYECAIFMDNNNDVKTSLVFSKNRWFPIEGGSSTLNITVERPDIIENCTRLLKAIHWRGAADIDLIQDPRDNIAKIMEINPRVSGSVKICFDAGVDMARQMLELAYNEPVTKYDTYKTGRRLRCSQTDLLWFIKSNNRFNASPSWFSLKNTKDQIFSWSDPLPWFSFTAQGLSKYITEMEKRKR